MKDIILDASIHSHARLYGSRALGVYKDNSDYDFYTTFKKIGNYELSKFELNLSNFKVKNEELESYMPSVPTGNFMLLMGVPYMVGNNNIAKADLLVFEDDKDKVIMDNTINFLKHIQQYVKGKQTRLVMHNLALRHFGFTESKYKTNLNILDRDTKVFDILMDDYNNRTDTPF